MEAFPRVSAQIDVVCKRRSKEAQERAEKEGGAHRGQSWGGSAESGRKEELRSVLSKYLSVHKGREQAKAEVDKPGGHARHLFQLASGKSGSAESWPKEKLFGEDMIHFYPIFWEITAMKV